MRRREILRLVALTAGTIPIIGCKVQPRTFDSPPERSLLEDSIDYNDSNVLYRTAKIAVPGISQRKRFK